MVALLTCWEQGRAGLHKAPWCILLANFRHEHQARLGGANELKSEIPATLKPEQEQVPLVFLGINDSDDSGHALVLTSFLSFNPSLKFSSWC